jgi:hypothetical protein
MSEVRVTQDRSPPSCSALMRLQPSLGSHDDFMMPSPRQFARHAAQEMRVAVVPAGGEGVIEEYRFHASISPPSLACERREPLANNDAYSER